MENDPKKQTEKYPVREGTDDYAIRHDKNAPAKNAYPDEDVKDRQYDVQPEYTEEQPNKKSPSTPA